MLETEELNSSVSVPGGTPMQENALAPTLTLQQHDSMLQVDQEESAREEDDEEEACDEEYLLAELCRREFTVFVLSEAGKPIFASCGHEEQLCSLMALVQTFVMVVASWGDCLMRIRSADLHICFSHRNPLILCVVSRDDFQLNAQVDLVYKQVEEYHEQSLKVKDVIAELRITSMQRDLFLCISEIKKVAVSSEKREDCGSEAEISSTVISTLCRAQLVSVFQKRGPNFDLRLLLRGAERHLNGIVHSFRCETSVFLRCVRVFAMNSFERELIANTIVNCVNNAKVSNVIFGLVVAHRQLVAVVRMKGIALHPSDLHILINLVECNQSFRNADNWIPICLPHFNDTGFVHAFVSYLWEGSPACLMLLSLERGAFQSLREVNVAIAARLLSPKYRAAIQAALEKPPVFELDPASFPDIWHFVYKNRCSGQTCSAPWRIPYVSESERRRLLWYYKKMVGFCLETAEVKHLFATTPHNCLMSHITQNFELHCVLSPFAQRHVASSQAERLLKVLKKEESRFFITSSLFF